jgi:hypothetical protein
VLVSDLLFLLRSSRDRPATQDLSLALIISDDIGFADAAFIVSRPAWKCTGTCTPRRLLIL